MTAAILAITRFKLVYADWRGYAISLFSLVWIANQYVSIYNRLRLDIKDEHIAINADQKQMETISKSGRKKQLSHAVSKSVLFSPKLGSAGKL